MPILHVEVPAAWKRQHRRIGLSRVDIRPSGFRPRRPGQITNPQWQRCVTGQTLQEEEKTCVCPMVVSQWNLAARTVKAKPAQGTPWWPSQWSSLEPACSCAHLERCPRASNVSTNSQKKATHASPKARQEDVRAHITFGSRKISMVYTAFV